MSQAGKVLHLYVEVRPAAGEDGKPPGNAGTGQLMLQCPETLPSSQRSSNRSSSSYSPELSPATHLQLENTCVSPSKSSRQSVTFQLQNPDGAGSSGLDQRHMCDSLGQLLQVLAPETLSQSSQHGSPGPTWQERDPKEGRVLLSPSSTSSGRMTSPPSSLARSCAVQGLEGDGGQTSLVTYGYIEKSHVQKMGGHHPPVCQRELDRPPHRMDGPFMTPTQKRLSDPLWDSGRPAQGDHPSAGYPHSEPQNLPQWCWSYTQRAANNAASRDARILDEFTSPMLRRRYGGYNPATCSPTLPRNYQSPRCRSWAGSPVLPRGSLTLPSKPQPVELDGGVCRNSVNGLPRSPASDHLCAHAQYSPYSVTPARNVQCQSQTQRAQRPHVMAESPRLPNKFYPPLPAGRPTDIQHELSGSSRGRTGYHTGGKPPHSGYYSYNANNATNSLCYHVSDVLSTKSQYNSARCSRASNAASPTSGRRSISPSSMDEVAAKQAVYACELTADFADRGTRSPSSSPAESQRSESPNMEGTYLHPYANLLGRRSPEHNHRRKTEQIPPLTRPGCISPGPSKKGLCSQPQSPVLDLHRQRAPSPSKTSAHHYQPLQHAGSKASVTEQQQHNHFWDRLQRDSPERSRRSQTKETPASFASRNHGWGESGPVQCGGSLHEDKCRQSTCSTNGARLDERPRRGGGNLQMPLISVSREQTELLDHTGSGASSQSSSGVTGSVGDSSHPSPETLSQSSQDTSGTGSAMQVGWAGGRRGFGSMLEYGVRSPQ